MARKKQRFKRINNNMRISNKDKAEYSRLRKNAMSKLSRVQKNFGKDLTGEISLPKLSEFSSRDEFNQWKQKVSSFTNRNNLNYQFKKNQYGVVANKHILNEIERVTKRAQKVALEKVKSLKEVVNKNIVSRGKIQAETLGQHIAKMGKPNQSTGIYVPEDFDFQQIRHEKDLLKKLENMTNKSNPEYYRKRDILMKENFKKILELTYHSDADYLISLIDKIPPDDFYELYLLFDEFDFDEYSSEGQVEFADQDNLNAMISYAEAYADGELDLSLKNFPNKF